LAKRQLRENKDLLRQHIFTTGAPDECKFVASDMHKNNDSFRLEASERGTKTMDDLGEDTKRFIDRHTASGDRQRVRRDAAAEHASRFSGRKPG
jgi:hypothetical protein